MREDGWATRANLPLVKRRPASFRVKLHSVGKSGRESCKRLLAGESSPCGPSGNDDYDSRYFDCYELSRVE
jgi:hypothetical protein